MSTKAAARPTGIDVLDRPVSAGEKADYVHRMFDDIAPRYDLLNTVLSAGIHRSWRNLAARCANLTAGNSVLDVCTGTGEWTAALKRAVGKSGMVVGADFSLPMLRGGDKRFDANDASRTQADAARLPFRDAVFDAATVAFGIRNVADRLEGFREMARVVKPGGRVVCLEFAAPHDGPFRVLYEAHARWVMPKIGGVLSGRPDAYAYLPASVERFSSRAQLAELMREAGLTDVRWIDLTFGLVCVHVGVKPSMKR